MKLRRNKKGFTIIELVIVIAVIGILAAVLIPTFVNLTNKANEAADQSLVKNLNTALAMEAQEQGHEKSYTLQGAINDLNDQGFALEQIISRSGKDLLWDQTKNEFLLNTDAELQGSNYWQIVNDIPTNQRFSYYAGKDFNRAEVTGIKYGFDAGTHKTITSVEYVGIGSKQTQPVYLRGNGDQCTVQINAYVNANNASDGDEVGFYGFTKYLDVVKVPNASLHIHGSVNELSVKAGHAVIESTGIVFDVVQVGNAASGEGATVTNNGYVAEASLKNNEAAAVAEAKNNIETADGKKGDEAVGGDYLISTLPQLETFRDAVNSGNNFKGLSVKLTKDITLNDGWTPIGEGNRDVASTNQEATGVTTFFTGTFDGQGHTISNLNNKNFSPSVARITFDDQKGKIEKQYAYGLFALVGDGAEFKNLTLDKVDINSARYGDAKADSVAALVGYANGDLTVSNITVKGSIIAEDAVSGVVGRITVGDHDISIDKCHNEANITATKVAASGIVRFYKGAEGGKVSITNCTNTGTITSNNEQYEYFGGISCYIPGYDASAETFKIKVTQSNNTNHGEAVGTSRVHEVGKPTLLSPDNWKID